MYIIVHATCTGEATSRSIAKEGLSSNPSHSLLDRKLSSSVDLVANKLQHPHPLAEHFRKGFFRAGPPSTPSHIFLDRML